MLLYNPKMGILNEIVQRTKERLKDRKARVSLHDMKSMIGDSQTPMDFSGSIKRQPDEPIKLIAEIKKTSPSKGIIRTDFDHLSIAKIYEEKAASAVSVLTEEDYFHGNLLFIPDVRKILTKPILRKDFICDAYQIYESRAYEADAILLIAAILGKNQAHEYLHLSEELGLHAIFEVHDLKELEMALSLNSTIIGINNRDLKTLQVDIQKTFDLAKGIPSEKIIISESGIRTREDVKRLEHEGVDAMLIGTALMEADNIGKKMDEFVGQV
jgi:indole-3-glycerol phosphate synthase